MTKVISVRLGQTNGQKANAPLGSLPQSNIIHSSGEKSIGSGWRVWFHEGSCYHLGGNRSRKPTIYRLHIGGGDVGWVSKGVDQSTAQTMYELVGM